MPAVMFYLFTDVIDMLKVSLYSKISVVVGIVLILHLSNEKWFPIGQNMKKIQLEINVKYQLDKQLFRTLTSLVL
jgi:hypothetical protein